MPKPTDAGGKRLISLAPDAWVQWGTDRADLRAEAVLSAEFQWLSRLSNALVRVFSPTEGYSLVLIELRLAYDPHLARRIQAYAALAEERCRLPVYPVVIYVLPPPTSMVLVDYHESVCLGLRRRCEYRVVNLWELDARVAVERRIVLLLPFAPVLRGEDEEAVLLEALGQLRADPQLRELEALFGLYAGSVRDPRWIEQVMELDMAVLRKSSWL